MQLSKDQLKVIIVICKELTAGSDNLSKFGLRRWKFNVDNLQEKIKKLNSKMQIYVQASTEESTPRASVNISMEIVSTISLPSKEDSKEIFTALYDIIQEARSLLSTYRLTNMNLVKAIRKYCKLLDGISTSIQPVVLTDGQINQLHNQLYRGATYSSLSAKFQSEKRSAKQDIEKSLKEKVEEYKQKKVELARRSLSKNHDDEIQIEIAEDSFVYFGGIDDQQKIELYDIFKSHILNILKLQKKYPLNPAFINAVGKFVMYLKCNLNINEDQLMQLTALKQHNTLIAYDHVQPKEEDKAYFSDRNDFTNNFNLIVGIRDKLESSIGELSTSLVNKAWNYDIGIIKADYKSLCNQISKLMSQRPDHADVDLYTSEVAKDKLKDVGDLLFKLMMAIYKLITSYRLAEVKLSGVFLDYCKLQISSYTTLLREYERKRINYHETAVGQTKNKSVKTLFSSKQLNEIYKDLYDGSTWPSKSAYFNEYRRQKKQELAATLRFMREEFKQEIKKSACSAISQEVLSEIQVKPSAATSFKRYNWVQRNNVYMELEYSIFEILELQKESPLNFSLASAVEKFVSALKNNYDKTQTAMKALTIRIHEREYIKNTLQTVLEITSSTGKSDDKLLQIKNAVSNSKVFEIQGKAEEEEEDVLSTQRSLT